MYVHAHGSLSLVDITPTPQDFHVELPSLRCVRLHNFGSRQHLSTQQMGELINSILLACPALEDLSLAHGDVLSVRDREQGLPPTLPGTNGSLLNLPSSLGRFLSSCLNEDCPHSHYARELSS